MSTTTETTVPGKPAALYGASSLVTGLGNVFRNFGAFAFAIVINAVIQAIIVLPDPMAEFGAYSVVMGIISYLVIIVSFGFVCATALRAATKQAGGIAGTRELLRPRLVPFVLWMIGWTVVVLVGLALWQLPGYLLFIITPFLMFAVIDGKPNPVGANFRAIGNRFGRFLVTAIIQLILWGILTLFVGLNTFFITGSVASVLFWIVGGFVITWFTCAWALIYRSTNVGVVADETA